MTSLVPYASSSEDEEQNEASKGDQKGGKRKLAAFRSVGAESHETGNAVHTSLGITSSKPLKGDWLCHVYIPIQEHGKIIEDAVALLKTHDASIESISQPHISLTKPILIRYHERSIFSSKMEGAIKKYEAGRRMTIGFSRFTCLTSEDTSRIYYTMEVGLGYQELHSLTSTLNEELASLHARQYFKDARYHCSFASSAGQPTASKGTATKICEVLELKMGDRLRACQPIIVTEVCVGIGSQVSSIALQ